MKRRTRRPVVTVYTRQGCGLCRTAEESVARVARRSADIELIDIDAHPELTERYTIRVPVVAVDGEELFEHEVDERALRAAIRRRARAGVA